MLHIKQTMVLWKYIRLKEIKIRQIFKFKCCLRVESSLPGSNKITQGKSRLFISKPQEFYQQETQRHLLKYNKNKNGSGKALCVNVHLEALVTIKILFN